MSCWRGRYPGLAGGCDAATMFHRHPITSGDRRVGQIGGLLQRFEHRHALAHAGGLDAKHLAAKIAAQVRDVVEVRGLAAIRPGSLNSSINSGANQLFGEIRAVFEDVERERATAGRN
jgi:hypothetical protein